MKLLVLGNADSWHTRDLRRAAGNVHRIESARYEQLNVAIGDASSGSIGPSEFQAGSINLATFDGVLVRSMPTASLEQVVFRMDCLAQLADQFPLAIVNPARTIEISVDKYLSLEKMRAAGLNVPQTHVAQTAASAMEYFVAKGCLSVVKPIFGSQGRNIVRVTSEAQAALLFNSQVAAGKVIYQQQYIEHGDSDIRLLVIGHDVYAMRRQRAGHWVTNVSQGAVAIAHHPTLEEIDLARLAARAVGALVAGVDVVYSRDGICVIEINACPSWQALRSVNETDIAAKVLDCIEGRLQQKN